MYEFQIVVICLIYKSTSWVEYEQALDVDVFTEVMIKRSLYSLLKHFK